MSDLTQPRPAPRRGRPTRDPAATAAARARILEVAQRLFARGGYEGVSMRRVAQEAGCSPAALYLLFPHKRALLRNIGEDAFAALDAALEEATRNAPDPVARLKLLGRGFVAFWIQHPDHFRALFLIEDRVIDPGELYFVDSSRSLAGLVGRFLAAVEAARASGQIAGQPREVVELLFCALHGVAAGLIGMPEYGWSSPETMAGRMVDALLAGLAPLP
jgi:AcrR family transcriptional regulator